MESQDYSVFEVNVLSISRPQKLYSCDICWPTEKQSTLVGLLTNRCMNKSLNSRKMLEAEKNQIIFEIHHKETFEDFKMYIYA